MSAQNEAHRLNHPFMRADHLFWRFIETEPNITANIFKSLGITPTTARTAVEDIIGKGPTRISHEVQCTPRCRQILAQSLKEARQLGKSAVDAEHLLLAMIWDAAGSAMRVLAKLGVERNKLLADVMQASSNENPTPADNQPKIEKRSRSLSAVTEKDLIHAKVTTLGS